MKKPVRRRLQAKSAPKASDEDPTIETAAAEETTLQEVTLTSLLSTGPVYKWFNIWVVGVTPLICHAWSHKAKLSMLSKQTKAMKDATDVRDPHGDFVSSLYEMEEGSGNYGFPLGGLKDCILSMAHKDRGVPRTTVRAALQLRAQIVRVRPALAGAICDMPLCRIYGGKPEMREDMVRVGAGLRKTATLAYRAQFWPWAIQIEGRVNTRALPAEALVFLAREGGTATGIGEWRNERNGIFGSFRPAKPDETLQWERYRASGNKKDLPNVQPWAGIEDDWTDGEEAA